MDARLELVEGAYRLEKTEEQQLELLLAVMAQRFEPRRPMLAFTSSIVRDRNQVRSVASMHAAQTISASWFLDPELGHIRSALRRLWRSPPARHSLGTLVNDAYRTVAARLGIPEFVGLNCPTGRGSALVIGTVCPDAQRVSDTERKFWAPVAWHLASGLRLREQVHHEIDAIFRVDRGVARVEDLSSAAWQNDDRNALRAVVLHRERVRSGRRSSRGEVWPALVHGRWTIVDRFEESGRRYALAIRNSTPGGELRSLSQRDHVILQQLMRGASNKVISIDLDVSEAAASRMVHHVLNMLGLNIAELLAATRAWVTPLELGGLRMGLVELPGPSSTALQCLTTSEQAVIEGVLRGHANHRIARDRGVAVRTVVNQVASAYKTFAVQSRRELILALIRPNSAGDGRPRSRAGLSVR